MKRSPWLVAGHYTLLVLLALLCVAPIVVIFATSLRQQVQIFAEPLNFIFMPTLENYRAVLQMPVELEEAAAIDGCGPVKVFTKILLPLMAPGLAAASIFTFRIAWNEFILALVLTDRSTRTLPVAASLFITDIGVDWGKVMAMGSLIAIPPLIFTFVAARQIITGLTAGAVKG